MEPILSDQAAVERTLPMVRARHTPRKATPATQKRSALQLVWAGMYTLAVAHLVAFAWSIVAAPDTLQVQFTPDDAYYYLGLAKNYVLTGLWTFDSGVSVTSGFHPLWAYLLSLLYRMTLPSTTTFVRYGLLLSSLIALALALGAGYIGLLQKRYPHYLLFLALLLSSRNYALNTVSIVEWALVLLFAMLYVLSFYHSFQEEQRAYGKLFLLGVAGSFSRSDFGLLPFSLLMAALLIFIFFRHKLSKVALLNLCFGLAGAIAGVALIFLHNYLWIGSVLQSSALMKAHWATFSRTSYQGVIFLLLETVGWSFSGAILLAMVLVLGIALFPFIRSGIRQRGIRLEIKSWEKRLNKETLLDLLLIVAAIICLGGYALVYSRNSDVQRWYSANLMIPTFLLLVISYKYFSLVVAPRQVRFVSVWLTVVIVGVMGRNMVSLHLISPNVVSPWPHQSAMLAAGQYPHLNPVDGRVGAWNAGIIGYYQGGQVVNLDGLVNDEIYDYAVSNTLPTYVAQTGITHIVDFETMLLSEIGRARGGYGDADFIARLQPIKVFTQDQESEWGNLVVYRVLP